LCRRGRSRFSRSHGHHQLMISRRAVESGVTRPVSRAGETRERAVPVSFPRRRVSTVGFGRRARARVLACMLVFAGSAGDGPALADSYSMPTAIVGVPVRSSDEYGNM